ncbi:MAG: TIGR00725 family protein [bacterium]
MKNSNRRFPLRIAVIGAADCDAETSAMACETGRLIAEQGWILITGGGTGVMEAAFKGSRQSNGLTIGILPGTNPDDANSYTYIPIATGLGHARNAVIAQSVDAVIVFNGSHGTLSEIGLALKMGKPVLAINSWDSISGIIPVAAPIDAINRIIQL